MAKRNSELLSASDKAKVRVLFAEVEGNNESVQEALKTMVSAMSRPVRVISDARGSGNGSALFEPEPQPIDDVINQTEDANDSNEYAAPTLPRKARGSGKKVDRNAGLSLVPDINFRPQNKQAFKAFLDEKQPKNDVEASLAYVYYMQNVVGLNKIGSDHVMTAFKEAGRPCPVDLRQTIRNVKKTKMWLNFTDLDDIRTTTQGNNFVEHEMGKTEKS